MSTNSTAAHTAGRWAEEREGGVILIRGGSYVSAGGPVVVARIEADFTDPMSVAQAEANARLIAAAPDYAAAAALAITALSFEQEKAQRDGDQLAYVQITQAKKALIAADNKRLGRDAPMKDVTPKHAAIAAAKGGAS